MRYGWSLIVALALFATLGCGSKPPAANVPGGPTDPAAAGAAMLPDAVVHQFLESLRKGDDVLASSLLTTTAREETKKHDLKVQPPGTPDMTYQIGQTEIVSDGAHVGSVWSEKLPSGEVASFEVIWVLRQEPQGWRIAGMATPVGDKTLFLDFENPADLLRKWQESETQMVEETPAEAAPAENTSPEVINPRTRTAPGNVARDEFGNPLR